MSAPWIHLLGGPVLWTTHFMVCYAWVEFACKANLLVLNSTILGLPVHSHVVLLLTLAGVVVTGYVGWSAYRRWQHRGNEAATEASQWTIEGERFAAFSGLLLSGLFGLVILLTGLPVLVLRPC